MESEKQSQRSTEELLARIEELEKENAQLQDNLVRDPLTGAMTRAFLLEQLRLFIADHSRRKDGTERRDHGFECASILFIDLDNFKQINDTLGHAVGDKVLKQAATTMKNCVRGSDTVARWGGEEFVILLMDAGEKQALWVADKIREAIEQESDEEVTASIGISAVRENESPDDVIGRADAAMYHAKTVLGKNAVARDDEVEGAAHST